MKRYFYIYSGLALMLSAGAAGLFAQNVVVDKSSLTFSAQFGGSAVSQPLAVSSTGSAFTFFTFSNAAWLKVNGQPSVSGTTPSSVTVSADPTGLTPGTYNTSLSVFGGANSVSVAITLTVSTIGVNPATISFSGYTVGSVNVPGPQSITLTGTATQFTAVATTATGGNWLQVAPAAGVSPGTITAILNTAVAPGLAVGNYQGKITITPAGGTGNIPVEIPVTFSVTSAPVVTVSPSPLQFNIQAGGTNNIATQVLTIAAAPAAQLSYGFTATVDPNPAGKNWITMNPPSGNTNAQTGAAQITIGVDTTSLPANTYNGKITLFTPGGSPTQQDIAVKLVISNSPLLNIPTAGLTFTYQLGAGTPASQNVNVTATSGSLAYTVAAATNSGGNWLTAPANGSTAAPFTVGVNPAGLAPGAYTGTVIVTGTAAGSGTQQIPVTLKVTNDPVLVASFSAFSFPFQIGQAVPASQLLKLTSSTGAPLAYSATTSQTTCTGSNWLVLNGNPGTAATGSTDASLVVSVNPAGLAAGTCTGAITIAATITSTGVAAANSPITIPVTLYVSNTALLVTSPSITPSFTVAQGAQSVAPQNISLTSTSPTDALTYTAAFQTNTGGNWLFVGPLAGTTASNNLLTVSVIPTLLSAGTYTGSIVVTATGPGGTAVANSPVTIPVTLTITAGGLTLSSNSLTFTYTQGGSAPAGQTVTVGSTGQALTYSAITNTGANPVWLSVTPASGSTSGSSTITVSVDGSKLTPGNYSGTVTVTAPGAGNSPATINVALTVQAGTILATPVTLTFNQVVGGTAPPAQTIAVTGTPGTLNFAVSTGGAAWLSASPTSGTTPGSVQVQVNAGSLGVGQYNSNVIIASANASGSPITIPVVLNVVASQTLTANQASLSFAYTVGQAAPASQSLVVNTSGATAPISVQVQSAGWLQVTPTTSTAPATLTVNVTPGALPAAVYNGAITITSPNSLTPLTVPVTFTVIQIPKPVVTAIGNAANYSTGGISPGENIVIFGTGVGPAAIASGVIANNAWGTTAGNTRVLFDGVAAPVIYASATQTSVMVPYGVSGRTTTSIVVEYSGVQSTALAYNVTPTAPGIYTLNQQGNGPGAVLNQDGITVNGASAPAPRGTVISVYMTGEGQTAPGGVDGAIIPALASALKTPIGTVTAKIGGIDADVQYKGSAPGLISGVMQVNLLVPATAPTGGAVPIVITVGGASTQTGVTVAIQ